VKKRLLAVCLASVIMILGARGTGFTQEPTAVPSPQPAPDYVPGEILVKFKGGVNTLAAQGVLSGQTLGTLAVSPYDALMRVQVKPGDESRVIADLLASGQVEIASVNHIIPAALIPDDPGYGSQWAPTMIQAPNAWNITTGSNQVTVAIVDSGLDTTHPEFSGRIVSPWDFVDNDALPQDGCGHGTHVAGIATARGNNGVGIAGLAWNVNLMPVRVLRPDPTPSNCDGPESTIHDGIYWAVAHGARVINLSLGAQLSAGTATCEQSYPVMSAAVQHAYDSGVLVVAAAGNDGINQISCPALQAAAVAVGATTSADTKAYYSNFGSTLDVVAPGDAIYSTLPASGYGYMSGTSMATPHVSGLAALIWSMAPGLTRYQVANIIRLSADDLGAPGPDIFFGYGRINAWRALELTFGMQTAPAQTQILVDDSSGPLPGSFGIQISTANPEPITWTAVISPAVAWLTLAPPDTGIASASTAAEVTLAASRPPAYGLYSATVVVIATGASGVTLGPLATQVTINYQPNLHRLHLPMVSKQ
jgi:thermitase